MDPNIVELLRQAEENFAIQMLMDMFTKPVHQCGKKKGRPRVYHRQFDIDNIVHFNTRGRPTRMQMALKRKVYEIGVEIGIFDREST
jgi:hypothetical protein